MRRATQVETSGHWPQTTAVGAVTLDYDDRHRRRMRLTTDGGEAILLDLEKATLLRDAGCDEAQGYFLCKPRAPDLLEYLLQQQDCADIPQT